LLYKKPKGRFGLLSIVHLKLSWSETLENVGRFLSKIIALHILHTYLKTVFAFCKTGVEVFLIFLNYL